MSVNDFRLMAGSLLQRHWSKSRISIYSMDHNVLTIGFKERVASLYSSRYKVSVHQEL